MILGKLSKNFKQEGCVCVNVCHQERKKRNGKKEIICKIERKMTHNYSIKFIILANFND